MRPSTLENYELNARRLIAHFGDVPISRLSPPAIQAAYHRLHDRGLSDYSVLQAHRTLHRALNQAFHWGLIRDLRPSRWRGLGAEMAGSRR